MRLALALLVVLLLAGGLAWLSDAGDTTPRGDRAGGVDGPRTARDDPDEGACVAPEVDEQVDAPLVAAGRREARGRLDAAVVASSDRDRRFTTRLDVELGDGGLSASATLDGVRLADGSSEARVSWGGAAATFAPLEVRIVDNRIFARARAREPRDGSDEQGGSRSPDRSWLDLGSASGSSLDVGRELLAHPWLLTATASSTIGDRDVVSLVAPASQLSRYARAERSGLVTELVGSTRSLRIVAVAVDGLLVRDDFTLRAQVPASRAGILARDGRPLDVVVGGVTAYCEPDADTDIPSIEVPDDVRAGDPLDLLA